MIGIKCCDSRFLYLIGLVEDWRKALDSKETIYLLAMDMSKAFGSLHHSLTLAKLNAYGFNNSSLDLMRSFFNDWKEMKRGCLWGSSFGPLVWNLTQNDLQ